VSTYKPPEPLRRSIAAVEWLQPDRDDQVRALITCDCGTATDLTVEIRDGGEAVRSVPSGSAELAFTCNGCGTSHWFTLEATG
jgi:hypothetical protein